MNVDEAKTISLAGETHEIRPIPFEFASMIIPAVADGIDFRTKKGLDNIALIIIYGMRASGIEITLEAFIAKHFTLDELLAASAIVISQSGLKSREKTPGEAMGD